jgi:hypothetical protein
MNDENLARSDGLIPVLADADSKREIPESAEI